MAKRTKKIAPGAVHVKTGDEVVVLSGSHRGSRGKVLQVIRNKNRVIVEGINLVKKTVRKSQQTPEGGFQEKEGSLPSCKVMLATRFDASKRRPAATEKKA
jgi:large subunit ribosomal protein L24